MSTTSGKKPRRIQKNKSKKNDNIDSRSQINPKLTKKQQLFKQSLETRKQFEQLSLEWQEKLYETVQLDILRDSAKHILPYHYQEIVEERNANNLCGYPICPKPQQVIQGQYRISYHERKIYDISELKYYCSTICFASSKFLFSQLSDEPLYLRNLQKWKSVDVIPLGVDPSDLIKQDQSTKNIHPDLNQRTNYVKNLISDLPPAPPGLVIKEKDNHELGAPLPPSPNQQDTYDSIEGFRIGFQKEEKVYKPSTLTLKRDEFIVNTNVFENFVTKECESDISMVDSMTDSSKKISPSSNVDIKKTLSQNKIAKKKNVVLQMSLFGKIWTALDRMTTSKTRKRFQNVNSIALKSDNSMPLSDDIMIMRIQIFTEKIMECFNLLKKQLCITANIESELIELTSTFTFDNSSVMFSDLENHILCMVFIYALSIDIPELYENIFSAENDKNGPFKTLLESLKLTIEEMDAFIRVLRVGST